VTVSDAKDAVAEALALNRRLAASLLVRKQELEAELAAGPTGGRAEALAAELASVDADHRTAMAEIAELRRLGGRVAEEEARAPVDAADPMDLALEGHEQRALDAVRAHIAELEAQAGLTESPGQAAPDEKPLTGEEADEQARAEFEALRAKRRSPPKKTL
jgi:hypothetical protein